MSTKISNLDGHRYGYGSIPITMFNGMNIHLPAILMFTNHILYKPMAPSRHRRPSPPQRRHSCARRHSAVRRRSPDNPRSETKNERRTVSFSKIKISNVIYDEYHEWTMNIWWVSWIYDEYTVSIPWIYEVYAMSIPRIYALNIRLGSWVYDEITMSMMNIRWIYVEYSMSISWIYDDFTMSIMNIRWASWI